MLAAGGFAFLFGCFLGCFLRSDFLLPILIISAVIAIISLIFRKKFKYFAVCSCFFMLSFLLLFLNNLLCYRVIENEEVTFQRVEVLDIRGGTGWMEGTVIFTDGEYKGIKAKLTGSFPQAVLKGDLVEANMIVKNFPDDFGFNERERNFSNGVYLVAEIPEYQYTKLIGSGEKNFIDNVRDAFSESLYKCLPIYAAELSDAMLLGNRDSLSDNVQEDFKKAGGSHFLAVSGLHLSVLVSFVGNFLYKLRLRYKVKDIFIIIFVVFYMFVAGFRFSVVRSGIMTIMVIISRYFGRFNDSLSTLSFAGLLILTVTPYAAADLGFLLSYFATFGIVLVLPYVENWEEKRGIENKMLRSIIENLCISLAAAVFTLPVSMCFFGYFSIFTLITNFVISIPCTIIISMGIIIAVIGALLPALTVLPGFILSLAAKFVLNYVSAVPEEAYGFVGEIAFFIFVAVVIMLIVFVKKPSKSTLAVFGSCFLIMVTAAFLVFKLPCQPMIKVEYFNFGYTVEVCDRDRNFIITNKKTAYLSYGGEKEVYDIKETQELESENYKVYIDGGYALIYSGKNLIQIDSVKGKKYKSDVYVSSNIPDMIDTKLNVITTQVEIDELKNKLPAGNYILTKEICLGFENNELKFY